jgi:ABC-type antimicrobial peptide transport system permease subunit
VRRSNARLAVAVEAMDFFSASTMALAMIISFFSLTSSMYANISEQTKEIGMLRALGVRKRWIQRVYTLEAFTLVTAATAMGLGMGTAVAYTVTAQRALFTQLPVPFQFPWVIFGWVAAASCLSALGASFLPATRKARQNIASLMRSVM